jgi:23S rRNA (pseudouridine1915-N3)-methyltransferase
VAEIYTSELSPAAYWLLSLSKLTLQHELALDQLYRVETFRQGKPYHR